jgi:hypothetical protein
MGYACALDAVALGWRYAEAPMRKAPAIVGHMGTWGVREGFEGA